MTLSDIVKIVPSVSNILAIAEARAGGIKNNKNPIVRRYFTEHSREECENDLYRLGLGSEAEKVVRAAIKRRLPYR